MKKLLIILVFIGFAGYSHAMVAQSNIPEDSLSSPYIFQPTPADMYDLDHYKYYTWGIDWTIPDGEKIIGANLFFDNIRNYNNSPNDLWVHLLETVASGVTVGTDNQGGGDFFAGQGILLNHWQNLPDTAQDITYTFDAAEIAALNLYAADGNFGFGFDPDCHFYNDGITLTIETSHAPIPSSVVLLSLGLFCVAGLSRRKQHI